MCSGLHLPFPLSGAACWALWYSSVSSLYGRASRRFRACAVSVFRASWQVRQVPRWRQARLGATAHVQAGRDPGGHGDAFKRLRMSVSDASSLLEHS